MRTTAEFLQAVADGDAQRVATMLAAEPSLAGARGESGTSALLWAVYHGRHAVAERILAAGVDPDVFEAAALGDAGRVRGRVDEAPERARAHSADGFSALGLAAFFGHPEVVEALLERGADPNAASRNAMRVTPLHSAAAHREPATSLRMAEALLRAGADPTLAQHGGWTPLHQAADHGNAPLVEALLARGADPAARSDDGATPADRAASAGHAALAARLGRERGPG